MFLFFMEASNSLGIILYQDNRIHVRPAFGKKKKLRLDTYIKKLVLVHKQLARSKDKHSPQRDRTAETVIHLNYRFF